MNYNLSRQDALRSFTTWGAYAQFADNLKGLLESGKLADFVILDRDIMQCPVEDIKSTQVLETVLGGETVYKLETLQKARVWIWKLGEVRTGGFLQPHDEPRIVQGKVYIPLSETAAALGDEVLCRSEISTLPGFQEKFVELEAFCKTFGLHGNYYELSNTISIMF
jgi:hypothetical protein